MSLIIWSGAPRAKRASGAPWVNKSTHPRKFGNHVTDRPSVRPSAPQAYQCLLSPFLATLGAQEKADCTSMLSLIDSCQKRVSTDQYHLTLSRAQVRVDPSRSSISLKLSADNLLVFKWSQARVYFFLNSYQICCVYVSIAPHYYDFDFKLTSDAKIQPVFLKYRQGRPFLTMVTCW